MQPFEIIGAPFDVYVAPSGEAFPAIDADPAGQWALLGSNGIRSLGEDGVTVTHEQTINELRAAGSTGPLKAFRAEEGLVVAFALLDLTLEAYTYVLNANTITVTAAGAGQAGQREMGLSRGFVVNEFAMLIRGPSPYDEAMAMQYELPRVYENASAAPQFTKGQAAMLECEFRALEDLAAASDEERFGRLVAMEAEATA